MRDSWAVMSIADLAFVGSGSRPPDRDGPVPVMGANGQIGWAPAPNFGPGYLVGRVGAAGMVNAVLDRCWASDNALTVEPRSNICEARFLGHLLRFLRPEQLATKNAQPLVTQTNLCRLASAVPMALPEQRRIAEILDTLDETIRQTEQVIAKLQQARQGLLHDLLTRGIDEHGELRDPERHPEQFQDSPLGRIPRAWEVTALELLAEAPICYGIVQAGPFVGGGPEVLMIRDLTGDFRSGLHRTSPIIEAQYARSRVVPGDVVVSVKGSAGRAAVIPDHFRGNISRDLARIRFFREVVHAGFARHYFFSPSGQVRLGMAVVGTTRAEISIHALKRLSIPVPPRVEQQAIAKMLSEAEVAEGVEQAQLTKLRLLKHGLMDDLLTGRVRTAP